MERKKDTRPTHRLHMRLAGWSGLDMTNLFDGITVRLADDGSTVLCGELKDQAMLFGILRSVETRGMQIIACFAYQGGAS